MIDGSEKAQIGDARSGWVLAIDLQYFPGILISLHPFRLTWLQISAAWIEGLPLHIWWFHHLGIHSFNELYFLAVNKDVAQIRWLVVLLLAAIACYFNFNVSRLQAQMLQGRHCLIHIILALEKWWRSNVLFDIHWQVWWTNIWILKFISRVNCYLLKFIWPFPGWLIDEIYRIITVQIFNFMFFVNFILVALRVSWIDSIMNYFYFVLFRFLVFRSL